VIIAFYNKRRINSEAVRLRFEAINRGGRILSRLYGRAPAIFSTWRRSTIQGPTTLGAIVFYKNEADELIYASIGGVSAIFNLILFLALFRSGIGVTISAPVAFLSAAIANYIMWVLVLFKHEARWKAPAEILSYLSVVGYVALVDLLVTKSLFNIDLSSIVAKLTATIVSFILYFMGRRFFVFLEKSSGPWQSQRQCFCDR
jgi:putative flippase GtrA